jgi:HlyD family secretion protein
VNKTASSMDQAEIEAVLGPARHGLTGILTRYKLIWAGVAALVLIAGYFLLFSGGSGPRTTYVSEPATRGDLTAIVTATGTVQPTNQVDVSSELSGTVRNVLVDFNHEVKTGGLLAELDTDKLRASLASSRAKLNSARAKVGIAKATLTETSLNYQRKQTLASTHATSDQDVDTAKAAADRAAASVTSAEADVAVAEAEVLLDETNLAKTRIVSPINGIILKRAVDPGQTVASSLQAPILFTIAEDLKKMEVQVDVDEADVGTVREGQKATFSVDAYADRKFPAQIRELRFGSEVVQGVVTYKAVLTADNSELLLRPGMTATAEITVQQVKDVLTVPNTALRFSPPVRDGASQRGGLLQKILPGRPQFRPASQREEGGPNRRVWILQSGKPVAVPVVTGLTDGRRTEIVKGELKAGQAVIVDRVTAKK